MALTSQKLGAQQKLRFSVCVTILVMLFLVSYQVRGIFVSSSDKEGEKLQSSFLRSTNDEEDTLTGKVGFEEGKVGFEDELTEVDTLTKVEFMRVDRQIENMLEAMMIMAERIKKLENKAFGGFESINPKDDISEDDDNDSFGQIPPKVLGKDDLGLGKDDEFASINSFNISSEEPIIIEPAAPASAPIKDDLGLGKIIEPAPASAAIKDDLGKDDEAFASINSFNISSEEPIKDLGKDDEAFAAINSSNIEESSSFKIEISSEEPIV